MNIQDIADFLDLVKNPSKYQTYLDTLKEEQTRLNAAIETVGKASELDKLRKEVETYRNTLQADFDKASKTRDAQIEQEISILSKKRKECDEAIAKANELSALAETKYQAAQEVSNGFAKREKALRQSEEDLRIRHEQLEALVSEYNEKVAKLRSVMA